MELKVLLAGGGTGGHVYPALAIAEELRKRRKERRFLYVGVSDRAEEALVAQTKLALRFIKACGLPPKRSFFAFARFFCLNSWGFAQSVGVLLRFRPDLLIATGGYTCAPVLAAAVALRRFWGVSPRIALITQNVYPGRVMRLFGRSADLVVVGYPESAGFFPQDRVKVLGHPIGRRVGSVPRSAAKKKFGLPDDAQVLLAMGGSQGSKTVNQALIRALPNLLKDEGLWVLHITGKRAIGTYRPDEESRAAFESLQLDDVKRKRYASFSYVNDIATLYAACDLAFVRAGATSLAELAVAGIPVVVVPKGGLPDDHQALNARWYVERGGGVLVGEAEVKSWEGKELAHFLRELLREGSRLKEMSRQMENLSKANGLKHITDAIEGLVSTS